MSDITARRLGGFLLLALSVAAGLLSRLVPVGFWLYDKSLGDVVYATACYFGLVLLFPRWRRASVGLTALGWCLAVESFQLTGLPGQWAHVTPVRWVLGTTFAWHDVVCYLVGIVTAAGVDRLVFGWRSKSARGRLMTGPKESVMAQPSVSVSELTLSRLRELAEWSGGDVSRVLEDAVKAEYDRRFWDAVNAGYAALRADPRAWAEELAERKAWEATLMDGLDPAERWSEDGTAVPPTPQDQAS